MRAAAPGKLVLSGAYTVLEGSPAVVCAVNRYAYAFDGEGSATAEVRAALDRPPAIDTSALLHDGQKLGLGSSAAALVAAIALRAAQRDQDPESPSVRRAIFARAREVHAKVQNGGSGVDVAAATFGGLLCYTMSTGAQPVKLPRGVVLAAFFSGTSARTSELRGRVDALRARDGRLHALRMAALAAIARRAEGAVQGGDGTAFVEAVASAGPALAALGKAADAPIVPDSFEALGKVARAESAAFVPSGAGGGDVGVFVGMAAPSPSFMKEAERAGMKHIALAIDSRGVHIAESSNRKTE